MSMDDFSVTRSILPMICKNPKVAGHAMCGPISASAKKTLEYLETELEQWEDSLGFAQHLQDFSPYAYKLEELRQKIGKVRETIAKPLAYAAVYEDAKDLLSAVRRIGRIDPKSDPIGAAKAYGAAMKSFGRLVEKLPPPMNAVGSLIAEMGEIFAKVVGDIVPHTRGTNRRVDEQVMQGGDRSIWETP